MCNVCYGAVKCPVCSPSPKYVRCSECDGRGELYFDEKGNPIYSYEDYLRLEALDFEVIIDPCHACNGEGEVIEEEMDYETFMNL